MNYSFKVEESSNIIANISKTNVLVLLTISLIMIILMIIVMVKILKKCGKPGWAILVPIYNIWVLFECAGMPGWLSIIPVVNVIAYFLIYPFKLAKRFGKSGLFGLGILLFSPIFLCILAFGKSGVEQAEPIPSFQNGPDLMATDPNAGGNINLMATDPVSTMPDVQVAEKPNEFTEQEGLANQLTQEPIGSNQPEYISETQVTSEVTNAFEMTPQISEQPIENINTIEAPIEMLAAEPANGFETPKVEVPATDQPIMEVPQEPVNVFDMPAPVMEDNAVSAEPIPAVETPEILSEPIPNMETPVIETTPEINTETLETAEKIEMPMAKTEQNINEAINENITETKTCAFCGFVNPYINKTCDKCGQILN